MSTGPARSFVRAEMPLGEGGETVHVVADGTTTDVVASADEGTSAILEKAGVNASPIDRVTLENSGGETTVRVARVVRGKSSTTTEIPFETEEREDPEAEEGTEKVVQEGVAGSEVTESYQETIDGNVTAILTTTRTEPTTHIVSKGTKEKKKAEEPKETPASSSDSSSSDSSSSGSSSGGSAPPPPGGAAAPPPVARRRAPGMTLPSGPLLPSANPAETPRPTRETATMACTSSPCRHGSPWAAPACPPTPRRRNRPCVRACSSSAPVGASGAAPTSSALSNVT